MSIFFAGVLSSLVAVFIVFLAKNQVHHVVNLVFFKVYPKISGKWQIIHLTEGEKNESKTRDVMELTQFGSKVGGLNRTYDGDRVVVEDKITGNITASGVFKFSWESKTSEHHDYGTAFVRILTQKKEMRGYVITMCCNCEANPAFGEVLIKKIE